MELPCFSNTCSSGLSTIPMQPMSQTETVMVSFSGKTYFTQSTATSSILRNYVEQEPPLWSPPPSQFQLMRNPTAQPLVGLGQPVTGHYTTEPHLPVEITNTFWPLAYPAQQHSYITPSAEQQTNEENDINLSEFPSEEDAIDRLLPSDEEHPTAQPSVWPLQQHSYITPSAELQTNEENDINLSEFPSEEDAIDRLLRSDEEHPTAQPNVWPLQQHSYITPSAELQTNENDINLSEFPSEEGAIDRLLRSDEEYSTAQPLAGLGQPVTGNYTPEPHLPAEMIDKCIPSPKKKRTRKVRVVLKDDVKTKLLQGIRAGDKTDDKLAEEYKVAENTVRGLRRSLGVFLRAPRKKRKALSEEERGNLRQELAMAERPSDDELQRRYDIASTTLRSITKHLSLDTKKDHKKYKKLTIDDEAKLVKDLREEGIARQPNMALAEKYNVSKTTLYRKIKKYDLQRTYYLRNESDHVKEYFQQQN